jgi:hypothetical protein
MFLRIPSNCIGYMTERLAAQQRRGLWLDTRAELRIRVNASGGRGKVMGSMV